MFRAAFLILALIPACQGDETLSAYGATEKTWVLESLDGTPWGPHTTIAFPAEGRISGDAPCNGYAGAQNAPYPWFEATAIRATKRACPELRAETTFFQALRDMTQSEVAGDVLLLRNDAGREMVFRAE